MYDYLLLLLLLSLSMMASAAIAGEVLDLLLHMSPANIQHITLA